MAVEELFGDLPQGWHYLTLGDVCSHGGGSIQTGPFGSQLHKADYVPVGIPSIMPQNIGENRVLEDSIARITLEDAERLSRYRVRPGDIVYSRRGDVEKRALIREAEEGWLCGTGCLRVRLGEHGPYPDYAAFYLGHPLVREWITRHAHGATMPNLNTAILSACPFVVPPKVQQRAIASILNALDDKIDLNRRMNETLEQTAQALFKDWFVDFGPTKAKMIGQEAYLEADLWDLFPERLDEAGVPEGWGWRRVEDIVELLYGKALRASDRKLGSVPVYGSGGITGYHSQALIKEPSIVVGRKGTVGSLYWVDEPFYPIDTVFYVVPKAPLTLCYYQLQSLALESMNTDAVVPGLNRSNVYRLSIPHPSTAIETAFDELMRSIRQKIGSNLLESKTLTESRDFLLPKLMSGEVCSEFLKADF